MLAGFGSASRSGRCPLVAILGCRPSAVAARRPGPILAGRASRPAVLPPAGRGLPAWIGGSPAGLGTAYFPIERLDVGEVNIGDRLPQAQAAFHVPEFFDLIGWDERDHDAVLAGSGGAARSVEVGLVIGGKVVVDDGADILDMDASCDNIGGD